MNYKIFAFVIGYFICTISHAQDYIVTDFGAVGDGVTLNTKPLQAAINKCSETGGRVIIPKGVFISGTLHMKSNVEIHIEDNGVLKGSPYFKDYPQNNVKYKNSFTHNTNGSISLSRAFIFAEDVRNIAFTGKGSINGNGEAKEFDLGNDADSQQSKERPCMLLIINSKNIKVYDLLLTNSAYWLQNYIGCDSLHIKGVTIFNHTNYNQDGIDIDSRNVLIEDCKIDVDDDGICFKSYKRNFVVENVVVRNCRISSNCNAIKFGTVSMGGFKNVNISNCTISKASVDHIRHWQQNLKFIDEPITVISGIAIEAVDGAIIEGVSISDITMNDVQTPIFILLGNRNYQPVDDTSYRAGQIKNIIIKNISATSHSKMCSSITGFPGNYIQDITLENIVLNDMGNGTKQEARIELPEASKLYPENRMYGMVYPASGFYIRHAKGIVFNGIRLSLRNTDYRPSIVLEDAKNIFLNSIKTQPPSGKMAAIKIIKCEKITINNPIFDSTISPFIYLKKTKKREIKVTGLTLYSGWLVNE